MIRMIQSNSIQTAKSYFSESFSKGHYYLDDQELEGTFHGKLLPRLGLTSDVTKDDFYALCENKNPKNLQQLTPRTHCNRRVGYDINFHCPKSVSIIHAFCKDKHILDIFQLSVQDTMHEIEKDVATRIRKNGQYDDRNTGEMVWAEFIHQTARPSKSHAPDPHLHAHCYVFNVTYDSIEKRMKAGQFGNIKRDMPYYQAKFHKIMSDRFIEAGYQIRRSKSSFEIVGVPQTVIDHFSKRTNEIGQFAAENGITSAKDLDGLGARTRSKKQKDRSMSELRNEWKSQILDFEAANNLGKKDDNSIPIRKKKPLLQHLGDDKACSKRCIDHAVMHCFERASVTPRRIVLAESYRHAIGNSEASAYAIDKAFENDNRLIHLKEFGREMVTTQEVITEEQRMVSLAQEGKDAVAPIYINAPTLELEGQQQEAVLNILTNSNRVSIIRGAAGSGKTTLMAEAVSKITETGKTVTVIAPTAQASRSVLRDEGFKDAETVAKFLIDPELQEKTKNQVLWIDEAGLLGTRDMTRLLEIAKKVNARVILGGDTQQHASVVRGDALRILCTLGGIQPLEVNRIFRQKIENYRLAVQDLSSGLVKSGFDKLDGIGFITEINPTEPNRQLVEDYVSALKKSRSALVISPTHKQGEKVTQEIRKAMRKEKMIGQQETSVNHLSGLNLTEAQKSDWRNYTSGQVIQFNQNINGFRKGTRWVIHDMAEGELMLQNPDGRIIPLHLSRSNCFEVYDRSEIMLSVGDSVQVTRNGFDEDKSRLNNGQTLVVKKIPKTKAIVLVNTISKKKYRLDREFGHINHAHVITSHAAQGKTVDEVFISQPASTFAATDAKQFYVSVSRGRYAAHIYTDDKDELLFHASEMGDRKSALELMHENGEEIGFIRSKIPSIIQDRPKGKSHEID